MQLPDGLTMDDHVTQATAKAEGLRDSFLHLPSGLHDFLSDLTSVSTGDHGALGELGKSRSDHTLRICKESQEDSQRRVSQAMPHVRDVLRNAGDLGVNVTALEILLKQADWPTLILSRTSWMACT